MEVRRSIHVTVTGRDSGPVAMRANVFECDRCRYSVAPDENTALAGAAG
ncbi:hypothetical protein [Streptomyces sp. NPDC002788]